MVAVAHGSHCPPSLRPREQDKPVPNHVQNDNDSWQAGCSTVARVLREQCRIPFDSFFLAAHLGNGKFAYFFGPNPMSEEDIRKMFRRGELLQFQDLKANEYYQDGQDEDAISYPDTPTLDEQRAPQPRGIKRPRKSGTLPRDLVVDASPVIVGPRDSLRIGDSEAVRAFYARSFEHIHSAASKQLVKHFVRLIDPRKQAHHPYTMGELGAPAWWPKPWGTGMKDKVRHIEPDRLLKYERIHLLVHILEMIVDPETQPPEVRKSGISVATLEGVIMTSLSSWFEDRKHCKKVKKKPMLAELFKVAKVEARYKRNEIDGTAIVLVVADDMVQYCFDDDDGEEDDEKDGAGVTEESALSVTPVCASPTHTTGIPFATSPALPPTPNSTPAAHATPFPPIRSPQNGAPDNPPSDHPPNLDAMSTLQMPDQFTHNTSRHSFSFTPTTEFIRAFPSVMYHTTQSPPQQDIISTPSSRYTSPATTPEAASAEFYPHPALSPTHHYYHQQHPQVQQEATPYPSQQQQHHHHHQQQQHETQRYDFRAGSIQLQIQPQSQSQPQHHGYVDIMG